MDLSNAIEIKNVSKAYVVKRTSKFGGMRNSRIHKVIDNVSFEIRKGEVLGIIGQNGSGKSTLLKLLSSILKPDTGTIECSGEVVSILELGAGFDGNFTGRENIYTKCSLYGFSEKEIDKFIDDIIEFSGLGEVIDEPLKTYSSGMSAKLALPTILFLRKDIMIFDEILSVGDAGMGAKCNQIFKNLKDDGKTIVITSHNMRSIERICDRVVWMDNGSIVEIGPPFSICTKYESSLLDSIEIVTRGAESGDTILQNRLGVIYRDGINVDKDEVKAEYWFRKAMNLGYVDSMMNLANLLADRGDIEEARRIYTDAADAGNLEAYRLFRIMDNRESDVDALQRLEQLSKDGNIQATLILANCYSNGIFTMPNLNKSFKYYKEASDAGISSALLQVGIMLRDGKGVRKESDPSFNYIMKAINGGSINAMMELANMYRTGNGVDMNPEKAAEWYSKAALTGNSKAMISIGLMYRDGLGVIKDKVTSNMWLDVYSKQSRLKTMYSLAALEKRNTNDTHSSEMYFKWNLRAAEEGFIPAMVEVGRSYRLGYGTKKDIEKAIEWMQRAAACSNSEAMVELGNIYSDGKNILPDLDKAFKYNATAANYNNHVGLFQLGLMYRDGIGVDVNQVEAERLFKMSSDAGNKLASRELKKLHKI